MANVPQLPLTPEQARAVCSVSSDAADYQSGFAGVDPDSRVAEAAGLILISSPSGRVEAYNEDCDGWYANKDDVFWSQI